MNIFCGFPISTVIASVVFVRVKSANLLQIYLATLKPTTSTAALQEVFVIDAKGNSTQNPRLQQLHLILRHRSLSMSHWCTQSLGSPLEFVLMHTVMWWSNSPSRCQHLEQIKMNGEGFAAEWNERETTNHFKEMIFAFTSFLFCRKYWSCLLTWNLLMFTPAASKAHKLRILKPTD